MSCWQRETTQTVSLGVSSSQRTRRDGGLGGDVGCVQGGHGLRDIGVH